MAVVVFDVPGVRYWSDRDRVERALLDLGAQPEVDVLAPEHRVIVRYDPRRVTAAELAARLVGAGYPPASMAVEGEAVR